MYKGSTAQNPVVITGAGLSGLMAALWVKKRQPQRPLIVLESGKAAGGHYRMPDLPGFGRCDRAMRMLYETGYAEFDALLHGLLPEDQWHILPDNRKDIAGIYWRGELQTHSPYPDLRRLPADIYARCEQEMRRIAASENHPANAAQYLQGHFGSTVAAYFEHALGKFYGVTAAQLSVHATQQPAMNRAVLYDDKTLTPLLPDEAVRARIAWPDQLSFPLRRVPAQAALYPKRFGMDAVIEAALAQLHDHADIRFGCAITSMRIEDKRLTQLALSDGSLIERPELLLVTGGLQAAHGLLHGKATLRRPPPGWLVYLRVSTEPRMGPLYHAYCFDAPHHTFRITHYANYCPDAHTQEGYPLCVELWSDDATPQQAMTQAIDELAQMGICETGHITGRSALHAPNLHALCTLEDEAQLERMRGELNVRMPQNMLAAGPHVAQGHILLYEVWRDMYMALKDRI